MPDELNFDSIRQQMEEADSFSKGVQGENETLTSSEKVFFPLKLAQREELINAKKRETVRPVFLH